MVYREVYSRVHPSHTRVYSRVHPSHPSIPWGAPLTPVGIPWRRAHLQRGLSASLRKRETLCAKSL